MSSTLEPSQSLLRQRQICQVFLELLQTRTYRDITVSDICKHAQIPRRAFYRFFNSKNDIMIFLASEAVKDSFMKAELSTFLGKGTGFQKTLDIVLFWHEQQLLLQALVDPECMQVFYPAYLLSLQELGHSLNNVNETDLNYIMHFLASAFLSILIFWQQQDFDKTPYELAFLLHKMLTGQIFRE